MGDRNTNMHLLWAMNTHCEHTIHTSSSESSSDPTSPVSPASVPVRVRFRSSRSRHNAQVSLDSKSATSRSYHCVPWLPNCDVSNMGRLKARAFNSSLTSLALSSSAP